MARVSWIFLHFVSVLFQVRRRSAADLGFQRINEEGPRPSKGAEMLSMESG